MKVSLQWLTNYIDLAGISVAQIDAALPMIGLEVESTTSAGLVPLDKVVVGEILSFEKHPQADKLSVCQVDVGDGTPRQIVCGAKNFKANDRVPVSLPGAKLPTGFEIKESPLRGVVSQGMMCSSTELGLPAGEDGLLILTGRAPKVGTPINALFPPADTVFEISVTANRGDALSHLGVARDLAAYFNREVKSPLGILDAEQAAVADSDVSAPHAHTPQAVRGFRHDEADPAVRVEDEKFCPYYTAWSIKGVKVGPSPDWLKRDLEAVGLRPINNIVDITNWVMLELGQPLHAFDAAKVAGKTLVVRRAKAGEKLKLLDGKVITLDDKDGVIADAEKPLVLAGIMGGADSGVSEATTDIYLECAWFAPSAVRRSSRKFAVSSDSSHRFTRDADPQMVTGAAHRAIGLIEKLAGGKAEGVHVLGAPPRGDRTIAITGDFVRAKLGVDASLASDFDIESVFQRLGFEVREPFGGQFRVTVPSFRPELDRPIDLVEEYVRIKGTEFIPVAPVPGPTEPANDAPAAEFVRKISLQLAGRGFAECQHYSLRDGKELAALEGKAVADALALANPLTSDQTHVRAGLTPGLLDALRLNLANKTAPRRFFEVGRVFRPAKDGVVREMIAVSFVILAESETRTHAGRAAADFATAKKLVLDIAAAAGMPEARFRFAPVAGDDTALWQSGHAALATDRANQVEIRCGLVNVKAAKDRDIKGVVLAGEVRFASNAFVPAKRARFKNWSAFPAVTKDIALIVDAATPAGDVFEKVKGAAVKAAGKTLEIETVNLFDVYAGAGLPEGKKSLAYGITFRAADRTLTDDETGRAFDAIVTSLVKGAGYAVR